MTAISDIQAQLEQTAGLVDSYRRSIADGATIDLTGLEQTVEGMCKAIADLPADQRLPVKEALITILDGFNALVEALEYQQKDASDGLQGLSSRQKAVSAYGKGSVTGAAVKPTKENP
jgi:hypothetical protein